MTKVLRVSAKRDGYRRCGVEHNGTVDHPAGIFTAEQVDVLKADPLLVVQEVEEGTAPPAGDDPEVARLRSEAASDRAEAAKELKEAKQIKAEAARVLKEAKAPPATKATAKP